MMVMKKKIKKMESKMERRRTKKKEKEKEKEIGEEDGEEDGEEEEEKEEEEGEDERNKKKPMQTPTCRILRSNEARLVSLESIYDRTCTQLTFKLERKVTASHVKRQISSGLNKSKS